MDWWLTVEIASISMNRSYWRIVRISNWMLTNTKWRRFLMGDLDIRRAMVGYINSILCAGRGTEI